VIEGAAGAASELRREEAGQGPVAVLGRAPGPKPISEQRAAWSDAHSPSPPDAGPSVAARQHEARSHRSSLLAELADGELVALAVQGDLRACEHLYRRHAPFALNLAAHIAGSTQDVEDVVHDSFLKAFDGLRELRTPQAFRSWLGSIVVHGMRSRLRRAKLLRLFGLGQASDPVDLESIASPEAPPAARAELAQVYALLRTLPTDERIAWTLRFVEGHDLADAAKLCECSLATVKRRIRRAQQFLEAHFVGSGPSRGSESDDARGESPSAELPRESQP